MNEQRIAILTDSGTDVPKEFTETRGVFTVPLSIQYSYGTFSDGVDIDADRVYASLETEIPTTSLPSGDMILETLERIRDAGYGSVLMITISSGLSGTHGMMRLMSEEVPGLKCRVIDTKNIGIGAGLSVIRAVELIAEGLSLDEIEARLIKTAGDTKVFFSLATLEYLAKGGRIGKVAATVGALLTVRPVISCNEEGVYYTVQRVRGRMQSIRATIRHAAEFVQHHAYNLAIAHGSAQEELETMKSMMGDLLERAKNVFEGHVSPALGVHTGPGLLGIGVQRLD